MRDLIDLLESFMPGNSMFWVSPDGEVHSGFGDHGEYAFINILGFDEQDWWRAENVDSGNSDDEDDAEWYEDFCERNSLDAKEGPREGAIVRALQTGWVRAEIETKGVLDLEAADLKNAWNAARLLANDTIERIELSGINGGNVPSRSIMEPELSRFVKSGRLKP